MQEQSVATMQGPESDYVEHPLDRTIAYVIYQSTVSGHKNGISLKEIRRLLGINYTLNATIDRLSVLYPIYQIGHRYFMEEFHATYKKREKNTGESKSRVRSGEGGRDILQDDKLRKAWSGLEAKALAADEEAASFIRALKAYSRDPFRF